MRKKKEIWIEVEKAPGRKIPVWWVNIYEPPPVTELPGIGTMLPGDFKQKEANKAAQALAIAYATSGYKVKLTTLEKNGPYLRYFNGQRQRAKIS